jgi:hypothetical protein
MVNRQFIVSPGSGELMTKGPTGVGFAVGVGAGGAVGVGVASGVGVGGAGVHPVGGVGGAIGVTIGVGLAGHQTTSQLNSH